MGSSERGGQRTYKIHGPCRLEGAAHPQGKVTLTPASFYPFGHLDQDIPSTPAVGSLLPTRVISSIKS